MSLINPKARTLLLEAMEEFLYRTAKRELGQRFANITDIQSKLGDGTPRFIFNGKMYGKARSDGRLGRIQKLDLSLVLQMKQWIADDAALTKEITLALGFITAITVQTEYANDYLLILPEQLHPAFTRAAHLFLSGPGVFDEDKAEAFRQYHHVALGHIKARLLLTMIGGTL